MGPNGLPDSSVSDCIIGDVVKNAFLNHQLAGIIKGVMAVGVASPYHLCLFNFNVCIYLVTNTL